MSNIEIKAFGGDQKGRKMWIGMMKPADLLDEDKIGTDIYDEVNNPEGYQRTLAHSRAQGFQRFMEEPKMFSPTTILLNIRGDNINDVKIEKDKLTVPSKVKLWIVDGQHRVGGIRMLLEARNESQFKEMDIPVMLINVSKFEEAILFAIFNKTQAGVKYDLVERVLNEQRKLGNAKGVIDELRKWYDRGGIKLFKEIDTRLDASDISMTLNRTSGNPWYSNIVAPNEDRSTSSGKVIRDRSFTTSLQSLIKDMRRLRANVDNNLLIKHLTAFWGALELVMPDAFADPKEYVLQKSTGTVVMHDLYLKILSVATGGVEVPTKENLSESLEDIKRYIGTDVDRNFLEAEYWKSKTGHAGRSGTSSKSFSQLENEISTILDGYAASKEK